MDSREPKWLFKSRSESQFSPMLRDIPEIMAFFMPRNETDELVRILNTLG